MCLLQMAAAPSAHKGALSDSAAADAEIEAQLAKLKAL